MAFPVLPVLLVAVGAALAWSSSDSSSSSPGGGGGGGGGLDLLSCEQAFALLPKDIRDPINAAIASPTLTAAQREAIAKSLEDGASKITDAKIRNAFNVAASCVRAVKLPTDGGGGGGGGGIGLENCATAFAGLPAPVLAMVEEARSRTDPAARLAIAKVLEDAAPSVTDATARQRLLTAASCLRGEAATGGGAKFNTKPGTATDPNEQILYRVVAGDNAAKITGAVLGTARANPTTWSELISLNPRELDTGRDMRITGTPGTMSYNWGSLLAGDHIKIPRGWNIYIDAATHQSTHGVALPSA